MAFLMDQNPYTEAELAYCAGIVDGEGYIGAMSRTVGKRCYSVRVMVGNTNKGLVDWLSARFAGNTYVKHGPRDGNKACWNVFWDGHRAAAFLRLVYPYLRIKRPQARLVMNYIVVWDLIKQACHVRQKFRVVPRGALRFREATHAKLKRLNALGTSWRS